jgi:hypothetical protein
MINSERGFNIGADIRQHLCTGEVGGKNDWQRYKNDVPFHNNLTT